MKRMFVFAVLATVAVLGVALDAQASGCGNGGGLFRRHRGGCGDCGGCATTACAAPAPAPVQYVEQKVTRYKQVMVEKEITEVVCKRVTREEKYTYTVMVSKCVPQTVKQTTYKCVTENVNVVVPVRKVVCVTCTDECGRCYTQRQCITENVNCVRTVVKRVPVVQDVVVNTVVCEAQKREGTRLVCEIVRENVKRKVQVCQLQPYTETIRVAVCNTTCNSCDSGCGHHGHGHRGGLFRRGCH